MSELPTGTVTFLFTDIEGSTRLLQALGSSYGGLVEGHDAMIRRAVTAAGGVEVRTEGDAFFVAFESAGDAVSAAVAAQRSLAAHEWPAAAEVRVRMGLHTGAGVLGGDNYIGLDVHRAARVASIAHGGQVLLSAATASLVDQELPDGVALRDLGGHLLKDLVQPEHIYQLVIGGLPAEFPALVTVDAIPDNLPTHLPAFIGRQRELADAAELLERVRLLTFTGPGGTGKTRLAIQLAVEVGKRFPDGAFFVSLASIREKDLVPSAIAEAVGIQSAGTRLPPLDQLLAYLAGRRVLLLLDNFEQVLGAAFVVTEILGAAPACTVLVTSRTPLRLTAEHEIPVPPLELPDAGTQPALEAGDQSEAVALFIERAQEARPGLSLDEDDLTAVAEVTIRLDGLPLAIELAAARTRIMSPPELLARLDIDILAGGPQDVPSRQRTLRNTISWSYDLLDEPARLLFERFSVFVDGATLEEAEAVCGPAEALGTPVLDGLSQLVEHSLLRPPGTEILRFRMLVMIRQFAEEQLSARGDTDAMRRHHAEVYLALAERAEPEMLGRNRSQWLDRLSADHGNLRAALSWALERQQTETAIRLARAQWRFWQMRGYLYEGRERFDEVLALPEQSAELRADALEGAGGIAYWQGDLDAAQEPWEEALEIQRRLGDPSGIANALYNVSFPVGFSGDIDGARELLDEGLAIYEELDDQSGIANIYYAFGALWYNDGLIDQAQEYFRRCIRIFRDLDNPFGLGWALFAAGELLIGVGELDEARSHLEEGLQLFLEARDVSVVPPFLNDFAALAKATSQTDRAIRLAGARDGLSSRSGADPPNVSPVFPDLTTEALENLDGESATAYAEGLAMTQDEAVTYALGETS